MALFAALILLAGLPAPRATADFPPGFANFAGSLLVADDLAPNPNGGFGVVLRLDAGCNVIQTISDPGGAVMTVNTLSDLRVDQVTGNIYVATDPPGGATQTIVVFDALGNFLLYLEVAGGTGGLSGDGYGIDVPGDGTVWSVQLVGAGGAAEVVQFADAPGTPVIQRFAIPAPSTPFDVAVGRNNFLYVTDQTNPITLGGAVLQINIGTGAIVTFNSPTSLIVPRGIEDIDIAGEEAIRVADPGLPGAPWFVETFAVPGSPAPAALMTLISGAPPFSPANGQPDFTATPQAAGGFWVNRDDFDDGGGLGAESAVQFYNDVLPTTVLNQCANLAGAGTPFVQPEGLDLAVAPPPCLEVSFNGDFGTVCPGEEACRTLSVYNRCDFPITVTSFTGLPPGSPFSVSPAVPRIIGPQQTAAFQVCFRPAAGDAGNVFAENLTMNSSDPFGESQTFPLAGTAGTSGVLGLRGAPINFGLVRNPRARQKVRTYQICNVGGCELAITSVTISGTNASDFVIDLPIPAGTIVPAGHCIPSSVRFAPAVAGGRLRTATITIDTNGSAPNGNTVEIRARVPPGGR